MNKAERVQKEKEDQAAAAIAYRKTMEEFVIGDYKPAAKPGTGWWRYKMGHWCGHVRALTLKQLVHEFELRDGPERLAERRHFEKYGG